MLHLGNRVLGRSSFLNKMAENVAQQRTNMQVIPLAEIHSIEKEARINQRHDLDSKMSLLER